VHHGGTFLPVDVWTDDIGGGLAPVCRVKISDSTCSRGGHDLCRAVIGLAVRTVLGFCDDEFGSEVYAMW
jgi:hypothetical protein